MLGSRSTISSVLAAGALVLAATGFSACTPAANPGLADASMTLPMGVEWRLDSAAPAQTPVTLRFMEDGRFAGSGGCNRFFGQYEVAGQALTLSNVGATRMACLPEVMDAEQQFFNDLDRVRSHAIEGGALVLRAAAGDPLLRLTRTDETEMQGVRTGVTRVFNCDAEGGAFSFTVRTGPGEAAVWLPERFGSRYLVLGQAGAASGAKYEGDGVMVWSKGQEALLTVDGEEFTGCRLDPSAAPWEDARRLGVTFRGTGNEPGWLLEITEGERIRFQYAYGEKEAVVPAPAPAVTGNRRVYRAATEAHTLTATVTNESCIDGMSAQVFSHRVRVELDGETFNGCGRMLR